MSVDLSGYVDVAARIAEFRTKHPDGSLQPADPTQPFRVVDIAGQMHIAVVAAAYRSPDDARPGIGMAYEVFPGRTPYTRGSELQNAETSAWGRAIVAALAADTRKGIASQEEVRNRSADRDEWEQAAKPPTTAQAKHFSELAEGIASAKAERAVLSVGETVRNARTMHLITDAQYDRLARQAAAKLAELRAAEQGDGGTPA